MSGLLVLLLTLLATGIYAGVCAGEDAYQIARGYNVSHLWQGQQRATALAGFALVAYGYRLFARLPHWWNYLVPLATFGAALCLFGFLFDLWLNQRRQLVWYYLGTDAQTAATDKAVAKLKFSGKTFALLKLGGVLLLGGVALLLASCAGSKPEPVNSIGILSGVAPHSSQATPDIAPPDLTPAQVAQLPRSVQRQYRKNLRAQPRTVPFIQGRAAVASAGAITAPVQTSYKPDAAVVQATDSAKVQVAQSTKGPAVAAGRDAEVPITTTEESWLRPLLPYAAGLAGLGLLYSLVPLPLAGAGWLWLVLRRGRKRELETG